MLFEEVVLGPGMILALAWHGVFSLHASAFAGRGAGGALVGESGRGKSTLARYLEEQGGPDWQRLADDILPLELGSERPHALPHFPQLKLAPEEQMRLESPERVPLAAVYVLDTTEGDAAEPVRIKSLPPHAAAAALVRHTVAGRLFPPAVLERHLTFCTTVAGQVPVRVLNYPRRFNILAAVREALADDLRKIVSSG